MKKNICFVLDQFMYGGIERVAINYLTGIDKTKFNVDVIILGPSEDIINKIPKECNIIRKNIPRSHNPLYRSSTMIRRPGGAILYYGTYILKKIFICPVDYIKTIDLRDKTYDVAIAFSGHMNDCYVTLDFIKAKKKIAWAHGMIYQYLLISPGFEKMYRKFDKIATVTHINQDDIFDCKNYLNLDVVKIYNPTAKINKDETLSEDYGKYILSVARLAAPKDFDTLIDAYNMLDSKIKSEYKLLIVGDGPDKEKIKDKIDNLGLSENILLLGSKENVDKYYQNASLFVLSTKSEGLGMVLIEAMGNGCPVIATDAPYGPRDILGSNEYGVLCPVGDEQKLKEAITKMLTEEDTRKKYIENGKKRYKDFELEKIMEEFYDLIK